MDHAKNVLKQFLHVMGGFLELMVQFLMLFG